MGAFSDLSINEMEERERKITLTKEQMAEFVSMFRWDITKEQVMAMKLKEARELYNKVKAERRINHAKEFDTLRYYQGKKRRTCDYDREEIEDLEHEGPTL